MIVLGFFWATAVHNLMIERAFPELDSLCRLQMAQGSIDVDAHQGQDEAYMHAMRSPGQGVANAVELTWAFIDRKYADAEQARRQGDSVANCYFRGQALHPVMDSTSPAHAGTQAWEPLTHPMQLFEHGDWSARYLARVPGLGGFLLRAHPSLEDSRFIERNPEYLTRTVQLMRLVDEVSRGF